MTATKVSTEVKVNVDVLQKADIVRVNLRAEYSEQAGGLT